jgi:hypothetical protein
MNALSSRLGIHPSQVQGERGTGYEAPMGLGEFECENCAFYRASESSCGQSTMKALSKLPRMSNGRVRVHPEGCCEYVKRVGRKDEDND